MVYAQYRYDALGRRVVGRTRRASNMPQGCGLYEGNWGSLRRSVWNGNAELYEVQTYGGHVCGGWADDGPYLENDTLSITIRNTFVPWIDFSQHFGRVAYTYGPALDQPLSAIRINFVDSVNNKPRIVWDPITIVAHWNWRGKADHGTLADGGFKTCRTEDQQRCIWRVWDTQGFMFVQQPPIWANGWWGTLLRGKQDATGTQYRRNRYVDPGTGRFTQEDPIGLAGGLNLYGFAGGDPINFGDAFGLCKVELQFTTAGVIGNHATIVTTAPDGSRTFFSAGPEKEGPSSGGRASGSVSGSGGSSGQSSGSESNSANSSSPGSGPGDEKGNDNGPWGDLVAHSGSYEKAKPEYQPDAPRATMLDNDRSCDEYHKAFGKTIDRLAAAHIVYNPFTTNSNAAAWEMLRAAGIPTLHKSFPVSILPGWGRPLF